MTVQEIGQTIRSERKAQGVTQRELAMAANTAMRFISDLENGKPTCQVGKVLQVITCLGIRVELNAPQN
jgi:y4mF family transcriptional regulator